MKKIMRDSRLLVFMRVGLLISTLLLSSKIICEAVDDFASALLDISKTKLKQKEDVYEMSTEMKSFLGDEDTKKTLDNLQKIITPSMLNKIQAKTIIKNFKTAFEKEKNKKTLEGKNFTEDEMNVLKEIAETLNKIDSDLEFELDIKKIEIKESVKGCEEYDKWLAAKEINNESNEIRFQNIISDRMKPFEEKQQKLREENNNYVGVPSQAFKTTIIQSIYSTVTKPSEKKGESTRLTVKNPDNLAITLNDALVKFKKDYKEFEIKLILDNKSDASIKYFNDLLALSMLDPQLGTIILNFNKKNNFTDYNYRLIIELFKISIGYVEKVLNLIEKGTTLTDGDKKDIDFATGFMASLKDTIDQAEKDSGIYSILKEDEKQKTKKFVDTLNELKYYLDAILCRKKEPLSKIGYDITVIQNLNRKTTNRIYCGWHIEIETLAEEFKNDKNFNEELNKIKDPKKRDQFLVNEWSKVNINLMSKIAKNSFYQIIDAPWSKHITYKKDNINNLVKFEFRDKRSNYGQSSYSESINLDNYGRPEKETTISVDLNKPFYQRFYVDFMEINETIEEYEKSSNNKSTFRGMQEARLHFILSLIKNFYFYLQISEGKIEKCTVKLCSSCFGWDLSGTLGDPSYVIKKYDKNSKEYSVDEEKIQEISDKVKETIETAKLFLTNLTQLKGQNKLTLNNETLVNEGIKLLTEIEKYKTN